MKHRKPQFGSKVTIVSNEQLADLMNDDAVINEHVVNSFTSREQQQACHAKQDAGEAGSWDCDEWSEESPKNLPKRLSKRAKKKLARNARRGKNNNVAKLDPSRTLTMRKAFCQRLRGQFETLKQRIVQFVGVEDAFGLADRQRVTKNSNPEGCNQYKSCDDSHEEFMKPSQLTGLLTPTMQHLSLKKEGIDGGHSELLHQKSDVKGVANAIENHGWTRLHHSYGTLYVETHQNNLNKVRRWVKDNVDPSKVEDVDYVTYPRTRPDSIRESLSDNSSSQESLATNCQPGQMRGADGRCGPGIGLGISREDMPQIPSDKLEAFVKWCRTQGVGVAEDVVPVDDLSPVQAEFRQERVDALPNGLTDPLITSSDSFILDGTHRWVKAWQDDKPTIKVLRIDMPVDAALELMKSFAHTKFAANANLNHDERGRFSAEENQVIKDYTVSGKKINEALRKGDDSSDKIEHLDSAIDKGAEHHDELWRGEPTDDLPLRGHGEELAGLSKAERDDKAFDLTLEHVKQKFPVGSTFSDKGYSSASKSTAAPIDASLSKHSPGYLIRIKNGKGLDAGGQSTFDDENEVLLPRDSKFKVKSVGMEEIYDPVYDRTVRRAVVDAEHLYDTKFAANANSNHDGTHRWVKAWQDGTPTLPVVALDLPVDAALELMRRFTHVKFAVNANPNHDDKGRFSSSLSLPDSNNLYWRVQDAHGSPLSSDWQSEIAESGEHEEATSATDSLQKLLKWAGEVGYAPTGKVDIVAFRANKMGRGADNEPLVQPQQEVARIRHDSMRGWGKLRDVAEGLSHDELKEHLANSGWRQAEAQEVEGGQQPDDIAKSVTNSKVTHRILDGTHRWVKAWQDGTPTLPVIALDLPAEVALELMRGFTHTKFAANANPNHDEKGRFSTSEITKVPEFNEDGHYPLYHVTQDVTLKYILTHGIGQTEKYSPAEGTLSLKPDSDVSWTRDPKYSIKNGQVKLVVKDKQSLKQKGLTPENRVDVVAADAVGEELIPATYEHEEFTTGVVPLSAIDEIVVAPPTIREWYKDVKLYEGYAKKLDEEADKLEKEKGKSKWVDRKRQGAESYRKNAKVVRDLLDHPKLRSEEQIYKTYDRYGNVTGEKTLNKHLTIICSNEFTSEPDTSIWLRGRHLMTDNFMTDGDGAIILSILVNNDLADVPDVQQRKNGCGPAAFKAAADSFGVVKSLSEWTRLLDNDEEGTSPDGMMNADGIDGLRVTPQHDMTIADLKELTEVGRLVLCPIQADGDEDGDDSGHWVVVLKVKDGFVLVQDPSLSNILKDADHSVAASGKVMIEEEMFDSAWHDVDADGNVFDHFGIAVGSASSKEVTNAEQLTTDISFSDYQKQFESAVLKRGGSVQRLSNGGCLAVLGDLEKPRLAIMSGVHGDERSGPITLLKWMQSDDPIPSDISVWTVPLLNDLGWNDNTRKRNGVNLNRVFLPDTKLPFVEEVMDDLAKHVPAIYLDLHEDSNLKHPYLFRYAEDDCNFVKRLQTFLDCKHEPWSQDDMKRWEGSTETFVRELGCDSCTTLETPPSWPLKKRVDWYFKAINWCMKELSDEKIVGSLEQVTNINPNHDEHGRFAEGSEERESAPTSWSEAWQKFDTVNKTLPEAETNLSGENRRIKMPGNRYLDIQLKTLSKLGSDKKEFAVRLDFGIGGKSTSHQAEEMQAGSLDFMRLVKKAAQAYHEKGLKLLVVPSDDKRASAYKKSLERMGMRMEREEGVQGQVWNVSFSQEVVNFNSDQLRDALGRFSSGSVSAVKQVASKATEIIDKVPGAKKMRDVTKKVVDKLKNRYGAKTAAAIVGSGVAISWGAFIGGTALAGMPVYIPTLAAMVPGAALAEAHHQITKRLRREGLTANSKLTKKEIDELAHELLDELTEEWEKIVISRNEITNEQTTNAEDDNCGTGSGGFQPGNTCGKKSLLVEFQGKQVDPTKEATRDEIREHIGAQLKEIARRVDKLDREKGPPEEYAKLARKQQNLIASDLAKSVGYKTDDEAREEKKVEEVKREKTDRDFKKRNHEERKDKEEAKQKQSEPREKSRTSHEDVKAAKTGDKAAIEKVVSQNIGMIHHLAKRYANDNGEFNKDKYNDLKQIGTMALIKHAIAPNNPKKGFDSEKNPDVKFGTYAWWQIKGRMANWVKKQTLQAEREKQLPETKSKSGEKSNLHEPEAKPEREHTADSIEKVMKHFNPREKDILSRLFGIGEHENNPQTLKEVAKVHDLTYPRVIQIRDAALAKGKKALQAEMDDVENANPNHDAQGRFTAGDKVEREGLGVGTVIKTHSKGEITVRVPTTPGKHIDVKQSGSLWKHATDQPRVLQETKHGPVKKPGSSSQAGSVASKDRVKHVTEAVEKVAGKGLAPLHEVRKELSSRGITSRKEQDDAINKARTSMVTGSAFEGRHGSTQEERDAFLHDEDGGRIGYLSLRQTENIAEGKLSVNWTPEQLRDEHGQWTKELPSQLSQKVKERGGFTYQPVLESSPTAGMAVSPFQGAEKVVDVSSLTEEDLVKYLMKHADKFADPEVHLGAWHDVAAGKVYLDLSKIVGSHEEATALAKEHNQEGYYDLTAGKTIIVKQEQDRRHVGNRREAKVNVGRGRAELRQRTAGEAQTTSKGQMTNSSEPDPELAQEPLDNAAFDFHTDAEKLERFQDWLRQQMGELVRGKSQEQLWDAYIKQGFAKGVGRSFDDVRKPFASFYASADSALQYQGGQREFLRSSFGQPVAVEKVQLLASRAYDELENVTTDMSNRMCRCLTDGMVEGKSPHDVAADMVGEVDISRARAETMARSELLRAHAEGQLMALENLGVKKLGVQVEWVVGGNPCPICADMEGTVFDIEDAHGLLPQHPNCCCCFRPSLDNTEASEDEDTTQNMLWNEQVSNWPDDLVEYERVVNTNHVGIIDESFSQKSVSNEQQGDNCGIGSHGFEPGNTCAKGGGESQDDKSKFIGTLVGTDVHAHAEKVKHEIAKMVGGVPEEDARPSKGELVSQKDKRPYDVKLYGKPDHDIEVKSMTVGSKTSISVHEDALLRKVEHQERTGNTFHTVVVDDRKTYDGGSNADNYSGNRIYYRRGSGRYALSQMQPVKNAAELKRLVKMSDSELPEKAKGSLPPPPPKKVLEEAAAKAAESRKARDAARKERNKDLLREQARARAAKKKEGD